MQVASSINLWSNEQHASRPKSASTEAQHALQNVFTAVLKESGREGYQSADELADTGQLPEQIQFSWTSWFDQFGQSGYSDYLAPASNVSSNKPSATEFRDTYAELLVDAYRQGGYATPKQYLEQLSREGLRSVQLVHRLAEPIDTAQLSEEGALNLLLPPAAAVDLNHDGLNAIGKAFTFGFPDSTTPRPVRDAWESATADLPPEEIMQHVFEMKSSTLLANVKLDGQGQVVGFRDPGDPDWINPMDSSSYPYSAAAQSWLDYLDAFKNQIPPAQYQRDCSFWSDFQHRLEAANASEL